jgi:hypothetical protein
MIERGEDLRFATKAGDPFAIVHERVWQNFQRDVAIELGVPGAIDLTHAAGAKERDDLVSAETGSAGERQPLES